MYGPRIEDRNQKTTFSAFSPNAIFREKILSTFSRLVAPLLFQDRRPPALHKIRFEQYVNLQKVLPSCGTSEITSFFNDKTVSKAF